MKPLIAILLAIFVLFLIWFCIDHRKKLGTYPKIFRDTLEEMQWKLTDRKRDDVKDPINVQQELEGYEYSDKTKEAIKTLEKREKIYTRHENLGRLTEVENAIKTSFTLGDLYGFNAYWGSGKTPTVRDGLETPPNTEIGETNENLENAQYYYGHVVNRLREHPQAVQNPNWMLDRIENFHEEHNLDLPQNFNEARIATLPVLAEQAARYANDSQNVHDRNVSDGFVRIWENVINRSDGDVHNPEKVLKEIKKYANNNSDVLKTLDKISETREHKVSKYNNSELEILAKVWERTNLPENASHAEDIKKNLLSELADGKNVCAVGRVSRILNSLVLLDSDKEISRPPMTNDMLRNEIFTLSNKIINDEVDASGKRALYDAGENILEIPNIKQKIREEVLEVYSGLAEKENLEKIIAEAQNVV